MTEGVDYKITELNGEKAITITRKALSQKRLGERNYIEGGMGHICREMQHYGSGKLRVYTELLNLIDNN